MKYGKIFRFGLIVNQKFDGYIKDTHCAKDFLSIMRALFLPHSSRVTNQSSPHYQTDGCKYSLFI